MGVSNPAGFQNRFGARIADLIIIFLTGGIISLISYGQFLYSESINPIELLGPLYTLLLPVSWYGYTLGRRLYGNRIVRVDGRKVGLGTMLLRVIVAGMAYAFTLGIGLIVSAFMIGIREDSRSIHDFIAGTYVTYDPPGRS
ncbi:Uncharacterized membrane protein YckC, RDD family [Virgibacillus subterraneus]|uniref:Uncharacterized membrane protein YckC, RDD family n=1 Tax=Virgibacillus subterraneus TaxID=621109 RepID=A0A1H8ZNT9_9BACI|nr:RDD family protein [Virgibacillus subterraneus]SEP66179.1 Uncharacterized membrane protein YckC, RDD family [Virgibacillus subterraneus]